MYIWRATRVLSFCLHSIHYHNTRLNNLGWLFVSIRQPSPDDVPGPPTWPWTGWATENRRMDEWNQDVMKVQTFSFNLWAFAKVWSQLQPFYTTWNVFGFMARCGLTNEAGKRSAVDKVAYFVFPHLRNRCLAEECQQWGFMKGHLFGILIWKMTSSGWDYVFGRIMVT